MGTWDTSPRYLGAMALSIKNPETERLARELAATTGQTITDALTAAVRAALNEAARSDEARRVQKIEAIRRIGKDAGARWPEHLRHVEHGDLLYDEHGLPK